MQTTKNYRKHTSNLATLVASLVMAISVNAFAMGPFPGDWDDFPPPPPKCEYEQSIKQCSDSSQVCIAKESCGSYTKGIYIQGTIGVKLYEKAAKTYSTATCRLLDNPEGAIVTYIKTDKLLCYKHETYFNADGVMNILHSCTVNISSNPGSTRLLRPQVCEKPPPPRPSIIGVSGGSTSEELDLILDLEDVDLEDFLDLEDEILDTILESL